MELKSTINIILKDLEDARDLIDDLRNYPGVPLIQIELARSKCRSAEDVIKLLSSLLEESMAVPAEKSAAGGIANMTLQGQPERNETPVSSHPLRDNTPESTEKERDREPSHSDIVTETEEACTSEAKVGDSSGSFKTNEVKESYPEKVTEAEEHNSTEAPDAEEHNSTEAPDAEEHNSFEATEPEVTRSGKEPPRIVADRFTHLSERINEQIGDSKNSSQDSARVKKNITDITKEIGINDRFFLIRELFGGSQEKYVTALTELNHVTSDEEAKKVIEKYSGDSGDREAGKMLSELVKRKLSSPHG